MFIIQMLGIWITGITIVAAQSLSDASTVSSFLETLESRVHSQFSTSLKKEIIPSLGLDTKSDQEILSNEVHALGSRMVSDFQPLMLTVVNSYRERASGLGPRDPRRFILALSASGDITKLWLHHSKSRISSWVRSRLHHQSLEKRADSFMKAISVVGVVSLTIGFLGTASAAALVGMVGIPALIAHLL